MHHVLSAAWQKEEMSMQLLNEHEARTEIRSLVDHANKVRLAVAFWGEGAAETLGLDREGLDIQIICNLDSGACNPGEIRKLLRIAGKGNVLSNPRLHAKIYWTPDGAILGSSNASANGLAVEGKETKGWQEANILTTDFAVLNALQHRYDELAHPSHSYVVTESVLTLAESIWDKRRKGRPSGTRLRQDFLEAYKSAPDHPAWRSVHFLFWKADISEDGKKEEERFRKSEQAFEYDDRYEDLPPSVTGGDYIIEVDARRTNPKFGEVTRVPQDNYRRNSLIFVKSAKRKIDLPGFPRLLVNRKGMEEWILEVFQHLKVPEYSDGLCVSLAEAFDTGSDT